MGIIQLKRIEKILENQVNEHIDLDEIRNEKKNIQEEELQNIASSQSFLLYALGNLTGESYSNLKKYITDGFKDNGLDAVYYSPSKNQLFLCQSKWIKNGNGGVDKGEILKFLKGVTDLLHLKYGEFNDKLRKHSELIENAVYGPNIKIRLVLAYSGNKISDENLSLIQEKVDEFNDTDEDIFFEEYNLKSAYSDLKDAVDGEPINAELDLLHWGYNSEPFKAYYGTVNCGRIAELLESANTRIYSKNIRSFIGLSTINNEIVNTLINNPENFFYLNNGIVLLCKQIQRSKFNSGKRENGKFHLKDLTVVNGAQTVGAINYAFEKQPEKVNLAQVFVKIISLEETPENFDKDITIASNTQNKIEKRDFVSLDKQQKRLIDEFYLNGLKYHTKRNDKELIKNDENFYFEEATISLACFQEDVDLSTYAKREIGKLWDDKFYTQLFNDRLNISVLINLIIISREIEREVKKLDAKERLINSHGIYLLTHLFYINISKEKLYNPHFDIKVYMKNEFKEDFMRYTQRLVRAYDKVSPDNKFPLSIFKNFKYCRKMKEEVIAKEGIPRIGQTLNLFGDPE